ncbi:DUF4253 domain-containing protein [Bacillus sp. ISL-35]|uniref:DUF4253 domain-containing protein n=1 Tax=Bacillus sp. ISL-35 TaxID=2819122 RepID=UPI001BE79BF3|nr:DUF4253 domain-containing protein [Bacillus sp. ISL-35]MBT2680115.1 DUF4253 domain-containing protein [Bacillus sp. ISL-35]MBT2704389.1 DUF4253 domain-containing protein [Chryseobacterium sp. ISL-80]
MNWKRIFGFGRESKQDINIANIGISDEVLSIISKFTTGRLKPFYKTDLYTDKKSVIGVCIEVKQDQAEHLVLKMREEMQELGFLPFICDSEHNKVCITQVSDQFDIIKIQQTNGDNYDITSEMVISKLKEWHHRYPFTIIGADFDWVEATFQVIPESKKLRSFATEMYKFCPDIVEQGAGSINGLMEELEESNKLFLWWD